jgi:hypothetical protein
MRQDVASPECMGGSVKVCQDYIKSSLSRYVKPTCVAKDTESLISA